jgi:site-2 protease. Metallo peptidase. MEROPS family M50B
MIAGITIVLVIGGLIFFHELGHFLVARAFGWAYPNFRSASGPKLFGITRGKTHYQLAAIPLGGYVMLVGEQEGEKLPENFTLRKASPNTQPGKNCLLWQPVRSSTCCLPG